jgi:iron(III) transport system permease protein
VYLAVRASSGGEEALAYLGSGNLWLAAARSTVLAFIVAVGTIAIGVPYAFLVTRTALPGRRIWLLLGALPLVVPSYVGALALLGAFGPRGLLARFLEPVGVERLPTIDGLLGSSIVLILFTFPYVLLLASAALWRVDPTLERAARGMGRSALGAFFHVTVPQIRSAVLAGALLAALYTLSDFGVVSLLRYRTLTREAFLLYETLYAPAAAAYVGLVLALLAIALVALERRTLHGSTRAAQRRVRAGDAHSPLYLGRGRVPGLVFVSSVVAVSLAFPLLVLTWWAGEVIVGPDPGRVARQAVPALLNAMSTSLLAAGICLLLALPVTALIVRSRARFARIVEGAAFAGYALPGVVIGLGLVFLAIRSAPWIYQTVALVILAYTVRGLPLAISGARSGWERIDPLFEQAARGMGRGPLDVFARITLPLAAPSILAGAALVFLTAMKELPATLILRPTGFETPATLVWRQTSVSDYSQAAIPALLLVAVAAIPTYLLLIRPEMRRSPPR